MLVSSIFLHSFFFLKLNSTVLNTTTTTAKMRLPSGTRMVLLLAFTFALITSEFPEFRSRGKLGNLLLKRQNEVDSEKTAMIEDKGDYQGGDGEKSEGSDGGDQDGGDEAEDSRLLQLPLLPHSRTSILVEATFFHKKHHYRKWGCGGCGGYRRMYYGHHHHYKKRYYGGGCHVCGKRK